MSSLVPALYAGGAILGGLGSYSGAKSQEKGLRDAAKTQWRMYQQGREDYRPWREAGTEALDWVRKNAYDFTNSPIYERQVENLNRQLAARGLYGGAFGIRKQTEMAENEGQRQYDRIMQLAGYGPSAAAGMAGLAQTTGANVGQLQSQLGQARGGLSGLGQIPLQAFNAYQDYKLGQSMQDYYNRKV